VAVAGDDEFAHRRVPSTDTDSALS
jgi:hypothetical protein